MSHKGSQRAMLSLLQASLWSRPLQFSGRELSEGQFQKLMQLAGEQAVTGLVSGAIMESGISVPRKAALEMYALTGAIGQRNGEMNEAVARLCREMADEGIRIIVFKGQTLAPLYPRPELRQSGDIDFICHPDDWERTMRLLSDKWQVSPKTDNSEKHVEFQLGDIQYELHRHLTVFAYSGHQHYWNRVVMPQVWADTGQCDTAGFCVPTLADTYNVLYVFVHIFFHLIIEGIGLRQFCDWAMLMHYVHTRQSLNTEELERHLRGIGLERAWTGLGSLLVDYLGLPAEEFPTPLSADDHRRTPQLMENIWEMGNFGHNKRYSQPRGMRHGIEHLGRIVAQARRFHHYAPAEAWWRVPYMFKWWALKLWRKSG